MPSPADIKAAGAYVELGLKSDLKAQLSQSEGQLKDFAKHAERAGEETGKNWSEHFGRSIRAMAREDVTSGQKAIERMFGSAEGTAGALAGLFNVGIPVVMLEVAGRALKAMADEAVRLKNELREGKIDAGDVAERLIAEIPIVGTFREAGKAIRELWLGENAALDEANKESERQVEMLNEQRAILEKIRDIRREISVTGVGGVAKTKADIEAQYEAGVRAADEQFVKAREENNKLEDPQVTNRLNNQAEENKKALVKALGEKRDAALNEADIQSRHEYAEAIRTGNEAVSDALSAAKQEELRRRGQLRDSELEAIDHDAAKRKAAIDRTTQETAKRLGIMDSSGNKILDPYGYFGLLTSGSAQKSAVDKQTEQAKASANLGDYERQAAIARDRIIARDSLIENSYEREKTLIDDRYMYEIAVANRAGKDIKDIKARQAKELADLERKHTEDNKEIDLQIAEEKTRFNTRGAQTEFELLELQRKKMLAESGADASKINDLFDVKEAAALGLNRHEVGGSFNAAAGRALGIAPSGQMAKIEANTKEQAETLKRIETRINSMGQYQ